MLELFSMMRLTNCLMAGIGVFIGGFVVAGTGLLTPSLGLAMIVAFMITGAGNVINDYIDVESDRVNRPRRPIPSGRVPKDLALFFAMALFFGGIIISGFINWAAFFIAMANSVVLMSYSVVLQDKILFGNLAIGYLVGSVFLFGGVAEGNFSMIMVPAVLMLLAMLSTVSREIVKDLEDIEGDKMRFLKKITYKVRSKIADRFGIGSSGVELRYNEYIMNVTAMSLLGMAVVLSVLPYLYGFFSVFYLAVVAVADIVFASCIYSLGYRNRKKSYARISRRMKYGMIIALLAFILGVFI